MKSSITKKIVTTVFLLTAFFLGLYAIAANSESYEFAESYLEENYVLKEMVGNDFSFCLSFLGYSVNYAGPDGRAKYEIKVQGEKDSGRVYLSMEKKTGLWNIKEANLILASGDAKSLL